MKILLTAPPGTGKSTVIDSVIGEFPGQRYGIVAREILDQFGARSGFTSINAAGGSRQFMFRTAQPTAESIAGEFDVDIEAIDAFVVPELQKGLEQPGSLTYIDEIGRAQAKSSSFLGIVRLLLASDKDILAAIVYDDEPWSMDFKRSPGTCMLEVTTKNRDALPKILLAAFANASLFADLSPEQQCKVFGLLQSLVAGNQFIAARKLFDNAIPYVVEKRIRLLKKEAALSEFVISGRTRDHKLVWNETDQSFSCDCDLANGRGVFGKGAEICSHQMCIRLTAK